MATISALGHDGYTLPVGVVISFLGKTAPTGFLVCDGTSKSQAQYPKLFSVLNGVGYGQDATTFNVPNLTNYFITGTASNSNTQTNASSGTTAVQFSITEANMPNFSINSQSGITFTTNNIGQGIITSNGSTTDVTGSPTQTFASGGNQPQRNAPVITSISGVSTSYTGTGSVQTLTPAGSPVPQNYIVQFCIRADY
jgi:microcystin-dependent protein